MRRGLDGSAVRPGRHWPARSVTSGLAWRRHTVTRTAGSAKLPVGVLPRTRQRVLGDLTARDVVPAAPFRAGDSLPVYLDDAFHVPAALQLGIDRVVRRGAEWLRYGHRDRAGQVGARGPVGHIGTGAADDVGDGLGGRLRRWTRLGSGCGTPKRRSRRSGRPQI